MHQLTKAEFVAVSGGQAAGTPGPVPQGPVPVCPPGMVAVGATVSTPANTISANIGGTLGLNSSATLAKTLTSAADTSVAVNCVANKVTTSEQACTIATDASGKQSTTCTTKVTTTTTESSAQPASKPTSDISNPSENEGYAGDDDFGGDGDSEYA